MPLIGHSYIVMVLVGAGPSGDQATHSTHVGVQKFPLHAHPAKRHRMYAQIAKGR
jgi:hypothetical protein